MRTSIVKICWLLVVAPLVGVSAAHSWGDAGHELICEIAFQEMGDLAREEVKRLIRLDREFSTFARSCVWPDRPKRREREHYVNVPRSATGIGRTDCGDAPRCLFSAIAEDVHQLARTGVSDREKLERLKYLGHWIGDLHQPLHVGYRDDRGGGGIEELGDECPGEWTLHSVWDTCLLDREVLRGSVRRTARRLLAGITDRQRRVWRAADLTAWADESYRIATDPEVGYCWRRSAGAPGQSAGCWYDPRNRTLDRGEPVRSFLVDRAYLRRHAPTVEERIRRAGVRLAALLDALLVPQGSAD